MKSESSVSWLAFGCPHTPFENKDSIDWLCERIEAVKPDVLVHLGDGHEADAAAKFDNEQKQTLEEEFQAHNALLKRLRMSQEKRPKSAPESRRVFLLGNHDDNILAAGRINPKVRSLCDFRKHESELISGLWQMPCVYEYSQRGVYRIGQQVAFAHGYEAGVSGDEMQAIVLNQRHPFSLLVEAHTHRPVPVTRAYRTKGVPLPYYFANVGTMGPMKPQYMSRKRSHMWGCAIAYGTAPLGNSPRTKCHWTAKHEILKMGDDE